MSERIAKVLSARAADMTVGDCKLLLDSLSRMPAPHDDATLREVFSFEDGEPPAEEEPAKGSRRSKRT